MILDTIVDQQTKHFSTHTHTHTCMKTDATWQSNLKLKKNTDRQQLLLRMQAASLMKVVCSQRSRVATLFFSRHHQSFLHPNTRSFPNTNTLPKQRFLATTTFASSFENFHPVIVRKGARAVFQMPAIKDTIVLNEVEQALFNDLLAAIQEVRRIPFHSA